MPGQKIAAHQSPRHPTACGGRDPAWPQRLEGRSRHRPDLGIELTFQGAGHIRDIALGADLRPARLEQKLAEHDAALVQSQKTAQGELVDRQPLQVGRLGREPALGRFDVEVPPRAVRALRGMDNGTRELQSAVTPCEHRRRDLEPTCRAAVGQLHMDTVDAHGRSRKPGQRHLAGRRIDHDLAGQDLPCTGHLELCLAPQRNIQALEAYQLRKAARQTSRHEPLHGHRQIQGLCVRVLAGAKVDLPGPGEQLDLGTAGNRAAAATVIEVEIELRHPPDALAGAVVDDDGRRSQANLAQIGTRVLAAARAGGSLRERFHEVDATERPIGFLGCSSGRLRSVHWPSQRRRAVRGCMRRGREFEGERTFVGIEQREASGHKIEALNGKPAAQHRPAAERDRRRWSHHERLAARVGDANVTQLELQQTGVVQAKGDSLDPHARTCELVGNAALECGSEKVESDRAVQQPHVEEADCHHSSENGSAQHFCEQGKRAAACSRTRPAPRPGSRRATGRSTGRSAAPPGPGHRTTFSVPASRLLFERCRSNRRCNPTRRWRPKLSIFCKNCAQIPESQVSAKNDQRKASTRLPTDPMAGCAIHVMRARDCGASMPDRQGRGGTRERLAAVQREQSGVAYRCSRESPTGAP